MYLSTSTLDAATSPFFNPTPLSRASPLSTYDFLTSSSNGRSQLQRWSSLIGIVTAIVGNILISFALNIQRFAHIKLHEARVERREKSRNTGKRSQNGYGTVDRNGGDSGHENGEETDPLQQSFHSSDSQISENSDDEHDSSYLKSPYWWGGIVLMTVGEAGNFLAYGFAPASIVSPLGVVALVSNCVIAPIMLKERFRMRDFWGVVVAVGGAVTVVLSAKQQEKKLGPHEILGAITTLEFEVYMAVTISMIVILMWASPRYGNKTILVDLGLVGLFGGYTALSTKGVASMLSYTLWRALTTPVTYVLVAVLVGTAVMQVKYVNKALQRFDSTQVIPVQFVMFTLSVIIGSAVLYRDFEKAQAENVVKFVGGCMLTFFGVFLITSGRSRNDEDDDEDLEEEGEERIGLTSHDGDEVFPDGAPRYPSIRRRSKAGPIPTGDSTVDDEDVLRSRRSSKVSFVDPRPRTPRMYSNSSHQPSIRVAPPPELSGTEDTPLLNPWRNSPEEFLQAARHPGMQSTISSPVLPSEAQLSSESLRPATARSSSQATFHTHPNHQQGPTPPQGDRPNTPARHSISRMMPGPLLSPLSGGLSVVVADSLRRGIESPLRSRAFRKARLGLRRTKSGGHKLNSTTDEGDDELGSSPLKQIVTAEDVSLSLEDEETDGRGSWSRMTRARSLSNALGDLFRGKRQKLERPDVERDEEAGPSGS